MIELEFKDTSMQWWRRQTSEKFSSGTKNHKHPNKKEAEGSDGDHVKGL